MQAWIKSRSRTRKDGRMVFITSVVFDAHVFNELCNRVHRERHRSAIVTEAVRHVLATSGWIESTLSRISGEEHAAESPQAGMPSREAASSNSRLHARNAADGPATRRSPASKPPSRPAPTKRGSGTPR